MDATSGRSIGLPRARAGAKRCTLELDSEPRTFAHDLFSEPSCQSAYPVSRRAGALVAEVIQLLDEERLGDRDGRRVLAMHDEIVRRETAAHEGTTVKSMGATRLKGVDGKHRLYEAPWR